jgi:aryl-alcohol dehydrogenase-like predicted oxidoreductase
MQYCRLGNSGLEVSRLGLGAIPLGSALNQAASERVLGLFEDAGGNLIDTANIYGGGLRGTHAETAGNSERMVGKITRGKRDRFVIASKGCWTMEDDLRPNGFGLSRAYLTRHLDDSLARLQTDYLDLYQCHCIDPYTPVAETMRVLDDFVRAGKIRYAGVSNWDGWQVVKANAIAERFGLSRILSNQIWYNLADRSPEFSIIPACRDQQVAIIVWGALAGSFLTGRFHRGDTPGENSRFTHAKEGEMCAWDVLDHERNWQTLDVMERIARDLGRSVAAVAMRWLLQAGTADVVLLGCSKVAQLEDGLSVSAFDLTEEQMAELRKTSDPRPHPYPNCFWELFCYHDSPFYGGLR